MSFNIQGDPRVVYQMKRTGKRDGRSMTERHTSTMNTTTTTTTVKTPSQGVHRKTRMMMTKMMTRRTRARRSQKHNVASRPHFLSFVTGIQIHLRLLHLLAQIRMSAPTSSRSVQCTHALSLSPTNLVALGLAVSLPLSSSSRSWSTWLEVSFTSAQWPTPEVGGSFPTTACGLASGALSWYVLVSYLGFLGL